MTTFIASIDLGGTKIYGALHDAAGKTHFDMSIPTRDLAGTPVYDRLCHVIETLLDKAGETSPAGIGVGVPGVVRDGRVMLAPAVDWTDMPLREDLSARFHKPVAVENDVNLMALGEFGYGAAKGASSAVCIGVGTGIGGGIVLDGHLWRGHRAIAGEVGYILPGVDSLNQQTSDDFGAWEQAASGTGIAERGRKRLQTETGETRIVTAEDVFEAASNGAAWAKAVVDETVDLLAVGLGNISVILDPEIIVLSGGVIESNIDWPQRISDRLNGVIPTVPPIVTSTLGARATALGATQLVLNG